jgi:hypothetical protein
MHEIPLLANKNSKLIHAIWIQKLFLKHMLIMTRTL